MVAAGYFAMHGGQLDEAEVYFREAYDGRRKLYAENHPSTSQVVYLLAEVMVRRGEATLVRGDRAESVRLMETAVAEARQKLGDRHWRTLNLVHLAVGPLLWHDQTGLAEALCRDFVAALERTGQDDWILHFARTVLGRVLLRQNRHPEAEPLLTGGYRGLIRHHALIAPWLVFEPQLPEMLGCVVEVCTRRGKPAEAVPLIDEFLRLASDKAVKPASAARVLLDRLRCCQKATDPAGCRATAEMWEKLNLTGPGHLYNAASMRAVAALVQAGYKNAVHMKKDPDLDALRERDDFKRLVAEVEKKAVKK